MITRGRLGKIVQTNIMQAKIILVFALLFFWLIATPVVASEASDQSSLDNNVESTAAKVQTQAIKTYYLSVSPALGRQSVKIDPPGTKIAVTSQSGDTTVRCGDAANIYSCSPGKRLELEYDSAQPLTKFWGENTAEVPARLQIDVYQGVESASEDRVTESLDLPTP